MHDPEADVAELLDEVFADLDSGAGLPLAELEPAQIEAWVSNLLAAWRTDLAVPDPTAADRQLVARCVAAETTEALLICRSVAVLAPASATEAAAAAAALVAAGVAEPEVGPATGNEQVTAAWVVEPVDEPRIGQEVAVVVGFIHPDSSEHVLLADLAIDTEAPDGAERLVGLRLDGPADGVIGVAADDEWNGVVGAGLDDGDDEEFNIPLTASTVEPALALHRVAAAWEASINDRPAIAATALDLLLVNQLVAAARLRTGLGADAPSFLDSVDQRPLLGAEVAALPADDVPADPETAAANAASLRTFRAALRSHVPQEVPAPMLETVAATIAGSVVGLTSEETDAVGFLEWADWLGVLIGLVRSGPGTIVDPSSLVDLINKCPEVSSTIPKADRDYVEFAFSIVIDLWRQAQVIADGRLSDDGYHALFPAALAAWAPS